MSAQFIHIETYARTSKTWTGKDKKGKEKGGTTRSIREISDEAIRKPGNCPHVPDPRPPVQIFGISPDEIPKMCEEYAGTVKTKSGQKLRPDALVCIAGVVSVGDPDREKWDQVKKDSVEFLKNKYGDRLKSVVEHTDEAFPHFHFYVIPRPGEKLEDIHEGLKARNQARAAGEKAGTQNRAYRDAMKTFQDEYSLSVSARNGLTRIGPSRRRLSRDEWRAEQTNSEDLAKKLNFLEDKKRLAEVVYKKAKNQGFDSGFREGFKDGLRKGLESVSSIGTKVGHFFTSMMNQFHQPTNEIKKKYEDALNEVEEERKSKERAEYEKKQAEREAQRRVMEMHQNTQARIKELGTDNANPVIKKLQNQLDKEREAFESMEREKLQMEQFARDQVDENNRLRRKLTKYVNANNPKSPV